MYIIFLITTLILTMSVYASEKTMVLQISGVEALSLSIPKEWDATVAQVDVHDDDPDGPHEIIVIGPPVNMGPFSVGDDIPEEEPILALYPQARLHHLSEFLTNYGFLSLPFHHERGDELLIIKELYNSSDNTIGYYQIIREDDDILIRVDMNMKESTWSGSARYPYEKHYMTDSFISVLKSIRVHESITEASE